MGNPSWRVAQRLLLPPSRIIFGRRCCFPEFLQLFHCSTLPVNSRTTTLDFTQLRHLTEFYFCTAWWIFALKENLFHPNTYLSDIYALSFHKTYLCWKLKTLWSSNSTSVLDKAIQMWCHWARWSLFLKKCYFDSKIERYCLKRTFSQLMYPESSDPLT